jgi:hypothetical protein
MATKLIIGLLLAVVLVLLYRGMQQEGAAVDPRSPLDAHKILTVLHAEGLSCNSLDSYTALGSNDEGWDFYLARCSDGGRYLYYQKPEIGKMGAHSCEDQAYYNGYRCPD